MRGKRVQVHEKEGEQSINQGNGFCLGESSFSSKSMRDTLGSLFHPIFRA